MIIFCRCDFFLTWIYPLIVENCAAVFFGHDMRGHPYTLHKTQNSPIAQNKVTSGLSQRGQVWHSEGEGPGIRRGRQLQVDEGSPRIQKPSKQVAYRTRPGAVVPLGGDAAMEAPHEQRRELHVQLGHKINEGAIKGGPKRCPGERRVNRENSESERKPRSRGKHGTMKPSHGVQTAPGGSPRW